LSWIAVGGISAEEMVFAEVSFDVCVVFYVCSLFGARFGKVNFLEIKNGLESVTGD